MADPSARIFTVEDFSADERLMIETAEQFCRREVLPAAERIESQEDGLMPTIIRKAGDLGLCGVDAPEAYGGLGLGKALASRILEFMSLNGSFSVTYGVTTGIGQVGLALFGNEDQKAKYLPRLTSGEWLGAYALSEPDSGSDALSISTKAERRGDHYVLNGTKMWISNAKWAELFVVFAKVDGERFSAFLVERRFPGVQVAREEHKLGLKGSSTARLILDNAEVPIENLLYEEGTGHHVAFNSLNLGRLKLSSMSLGQARDAVGVAARYAQERRQFGQSIASFGLIRKKLATMAALFFVTESMVYRTGALVDAKVRGEGGSIEAKRQAASEFAAECSICKVFSTEAQAAIVDEALQCFGGYGFTEEFPIARHFRDARVSRIYEGTNEINRLFISSRTFRRLQEGQIRPGARADSFITELADRAVRRTYEGQIANAAVADLIILAFADQSARLGANQTGGLAPILYELAKAILQPVAAAAFQALAGESVTLPGVPPLGWEEIAHEVLAKAGPVEPVTIPS